MHSIPYMFRERGLSGHVLNASINQFSKFTDTSDIRERAGNDMVGHALLLFLSLKKELSRTFHHASGSECSGEIPARRLAPANQNYLVQCVVDATVQRETIPLPTY